MINLFRNIVAALGLLLIITGCSSDSAELSDTTEQSIAAIQQQAQRFSQAYMDGDIETLVSLYTDDGIAAASGRDFVIGGAALNRFWQLPPGRSILHHQSTSLNIQVNGELAYDWGYYSGQAAQDGEPLPPFRGKYVIVWQLGEDGSWRMLMDMWNSMPAEQAATSG